MTQSAEPDPSAGSDAAEPSHESAMEMEQPDQLKPLRELAAEAATDRQRVAELSKPLKRSLTQQAEKLAALSSEDPTLATIIEAVRANLYAQELLLAEQSETFASFMADLAELVANNVEQLRANDEELAEEIDAIADTLSDEDGDEDEDFMLTDSVLTADDGNTIAAFLHEYCEHLRAGCAQLPPDSPSLQRSQHRVRELEQMVSRVRDITVRDLVETEGESGAAPEQPPALTAPEPPASA